MKIIDITIKDLTRSFRSAFAIGMMVVAPLLLTGLITLSFGGLSGEDSNPSAVQVGIVNLDTLPVDALLDNSLGDQIRSMFYDPSVENWITARDYPAEAEAQLALDSQEIGAAVIIPPDFTSRVLGGGGDVQVLIISDPTLSIGPTVVQNMVQVMLDGVSGGGIAFETLIERQVVNGMTPDLDQISSWIERYSNWYADFQRDLFHHPDRAALVLVAPTVEGAVTADPFQSTIALMMAGQMIFFAFFTGAYTMMSILTEDEEGTLARTFTTPTNRTTILGGKFLSVVVTVLMQGLVLMVAGHYAFGVEWGTPVSVALALTGQVIASAGLGVFLISFVKNTRQGGPVLGGGLTALGMMGGLFTANIPGMPAVFEMLANFTPQGWVIKIWKLSIAGGGPSEMITPFIVLVLIGGIMFAAGAVMFHRRYA